jgi:hypothetical protein
VHRRRRNHPAQSWQATYQQYPPRQVEFNLPRLRTGNGPEFPLTGIAVIAARRPSTPITYPASSPRLATVPEIPIRGTMVPRLLKSHRS